MRTCVEHFAYQVSRNIKSNSRVLVTGGGAFNTFFISLLKHKYNLNIHIPTDEIIEFKEALIFGFLGVLRVRNQINCLSSVTGVNRDHSSGKIYYPKVELVNCPYFQFIIFANKKYIMVAVVIAIFVLGYLAITLEHNLNVDKLIPALIMMALSWAVISFGIDGVPSWFDSAKHSLIDNFPLAHHDKTHILEETLIHHLGKTAEILVFLIGAMTIVEIIDYFDGFSTIKKFIKTKSKKKDTLGFFNFSFFIISNH